VKRRAVLANSVLLPIAAKAQPVRKRRVGVLLYSANESFLQGFKQAMREVGYVEGQNLELVLRDGEGRMDVAERQATNMVHDQVEVIVVWSTDGAVAAKRATQRIPIAVSVADPLGSGLVKSLARPEANITGVSSSAFEVAAKRVELLVEALPGVRALAFLGLKNETNMARFLEISKAAAARSGVDMRLAEVPAPTQFEAPITEAVRAGAQGLVLQQYFYAHNAAIAELALRLRLPAAGWQRPFVEAGGLLAFGAAPEDTYFRLARCVERLLAGVAPADLPIQQATRTPLYINLKTAKLLGLSLSPLLLTRADEVIE
jgi:putative ABC transport system substrate-binding protein